MKETLVRGLARWSLLALLLLAACGPIAHPAPTATPSPAPTPTFTPPPPSPTASLSLPIQVTIIGIEGYKRDQQVSDPLGGYRVIISSWIALELEPATIQDPVLTGLLDQIDLGNNLVRMTTVDYDAALTVDGHSPRGLFLLLTDPLYHTTPLGILLSQATGKVRPLVAQVTYAAILTTPNGVQIALIEADLLPETGGGTPLYLSIALFKTTAGVMTAVQLAPLQAKEATQTDFLRMLDTIELLGP